MNWSITDLALRTGLSRSAISARAEREAWPFVLGLGRGGQKKLYPAHQLPEDITARMVGDTTGAGLDRGESALALTNLLGDRSVTPTGLTPERIMNNPELSRPALARAALCRAYQNEVRKAPKGEKVHARERFATAYNMQLIYPELFKVIGKTSVPTLERWGAALRENDGDAYQLADRRGRHRAGSKKVTAEQAEILLMAILHPNQPTVVESIRLAKLVMEQRGISNGHSESTYRRFLQDWRKQNGQIWDAARRGEKALNDNWLPYAERDWTQVKVGDILIADGHVLNFEIQDPWTGKPKRMALIMWQDGRSKAIPGFEIMPTENTAVIASALRRAIIALGRIPEVGYLDNGKAFCSKFFSGADLSGLDGLFGRLGMKTIHAWPYHAQSKPIERFFETFGECERWSPSYTGTSIATKPPRLARNEKFHRDLHQQITGGKAPTLAEAHLLVAQWLAEYHSREHDGLDGQTPLEVFEAGRGPGVDLAQLDFLMLALEVRTISRNGISLMGRSYYDQALFGRRHQVTVRYDLADLSSILVYDDQGEFLCRAQEMERLHPAASILGTPEDQALLETRIEEKRHLQKNTMQQIRALLRDQVGPAAKARLGSMGILGGNDSPRTPADSGPLHALELPTGHRAGNRGARGDHLPALPADIERIEAEAAERIEAEAARAAEEAAERAASMSDFERYEDLLKREAQGRALDEMDSAFARYYRISDEYRANEDYFQGRAAAFSVLFQTPEGSEVIGA